VIASIGAVALEGLEGRPVNVEVHIGPGLPGLHLVGLPDASVRESHARVRSGITSSELPWPNRKLVVNLSPGDLAKEGPGFDLPIALCILAAQETVPAAALAGMVAVGEVGLDGAIRSVRGALSAALAARASRARGLLCPAANAAEAALVEGLAVHPVASLAELCRSLADDDGLTRYDGPPARPVVAPVFDDMTDVRGQYMGRRAIEVAAAGGHHLLLLGPPGAGKSMLARRLPGILPPLTEDQSLEVTRIHSVGGLLDDGTLHVHRPFRAPHHTISVAGLVGGGSRALRPGEVSLASHGVLFLDELGSFSHRALEALREPLDEGRIRITRQRRSCSFPARFLLVAAANPCPCGFRDDPVVICRCGEHERTSHDRRLSGPLLDRFDLMARVERPDPDLLLSEAPGEPSSVVAQRVAAARQEQAAVLSRLGRRTFGELAPGELRRVFRPSPEARAALAAAARSIPLSGRGIDKVRRVALTIACLEEAATVGEDHVCEALALRGGALSAENVGG